MRFQFFFLLLAILAVYQSTSCHTGGCDGCSKKTVTHKCSPPPKAPSCSGGCDQNSG